MWRDLIFGWSMLTVGCCDRIPVALVIVSLMFLICNSSWWSFQGNSGVITWISQIASPLSVNQDMKNRSICWPIFPCFFIRKSTSILELAVSYWILMPHGSWRWNEMELWKWWVRGGLKSLLNIWKLIV